ncbi:MAG: ImmA/IrrE family metallo-endopeptidase [Bacteroidales bacterium]|nr:ImmA/IrrE family metallo-endopeptidase [Bacteroidales bacterium]
MAIERVNIQPDILRWAIQRAGVSEEKAIEAFPLLDSWLPQKKQPTLNQLKRFAVKFYVPLVYLFMDNRPEEVIPFPMFRGEAGQQDHFDLNVYDTVMNVQARQEWLEEYLLENEIETCSFIGSINTQVSISEAVNKLRSILDLDPKWAFSMSSSDAALSYIGQRVEDAGVFLAYNGVVGNNTHRLLKVSECRGFALVNEKAPYIFINSADSKSAQLFTLVHEVTHLMLGKSAGHAGSETFHYEITEQYCDKVAAEFLVPASVLREVWNNDTKFASRRFKVSELVIARRAHDLGLMSDAAYREFWLSYSKRPVNVKKTSSGGSFYLTSVKRVGRNFAIHVRNAVNNRQLSYTEAYRLTGLYGKTYDSFMTNNI